MIARNGGASIWRLSLRFHVPYILRLFKTNIYAKAKVKITVLLLCDPVQTLPDASTAVPDVKQKTLLTIVVS